MNLSQAKLMLKQLNLHKLSDASRLKFIGCPTLVETYLKDVCV